MRSSLPHLPKTPPGDGVFRICATDRSPARTNDSTGWRIPSIKIEEAIAAAARNALKQATTGDSGQEPSSLDADPECEAVIQDINLVDSALLELVETVKIDLGYLEIHLLPKKLAALLNISAADIPDRLRTFPVPFQRRRRGVETELIFGHQALAVDPVLLKWVARGWVWWKEIRDGKSSLGEIAQRENVSARFISKHLEHEFLPPRSGGSCAGRPAPEFHERSSTSLNAFIPNLGRSAQNPRRTRGSGRKIAFHRSFLTRN